MLLHLLCGLLNRSSLVGLLNKSKPHLFVNALLNFGIFVSVDDFKATPDKSPTDLTISANSSKSLLEGAIAGKGFVYKERNPWTTISCTIVMCPHIRLITGDKYVAGLHVSEFTRFSNIYFDVCLAKEFSTSIIAISRREYKLCHAGALLGKLLQGCFFVAIHCDVTLDARFKDFEAHILWLKEIVSGWVLH